MLVYQEGICNGPNPMKPNGSSLGAPRRIQWRPQERRQREEAAMRKQVAMEPGEPMDHGFVVESGTFGLMIKLMTYSCLKNIQLTFFGCDPHPEKHYSDWIPT